MSLLNNANHHPSLQLVVVVTSKITHHREFSGGPVVRTQDFYFWGPGSIPGWGTKIPQAAWSSQKKKKSLI